MHIIYLHGLDSNPDATKAVITSDAAKIHNIQTHRPNLNCAPEQALAKILQLIQNYPNSVLIGSSLGGYFASLVSDITGRPAILLNPSIRPDLSFQRFLADNFHSKTLNPDSVIYTTVYGWQILYQDLSWFKKHPIQVNYPNKIKVLLKMADELLPSKKTAQFFLAKGAEVFCQEGGDHRFSDYDVQVDTVVNLVKQLLS
ncbi:MAG: YqiA/YcfP family alpha/beta fold hydrolase [Moraxella sp.]